MSGITFGSVGDIIAVGQVGWALAQALSSLRGSSKEYQALDKELRRFDEALMQVVVLWQSYIDSPELHQLGIITKQVVEDCRKTLLAFRSRIDKKYCASLSLGGSGNRLKDAAKKVIWVKEKEDILELRRKLQVAGDTITMLSLAAMGNSTTLASTAQAARVELVHGLLQESIKRAEDQMAQLRVLDEKLDSQAKASDMILSPDSSGGIYLALVNSMAIDMKSVLSLLRSHLVSEQDTPRGLGTHWKQAPVTLEDALGFVYPIPLELVDSWEMLDTILAKKFEKHPGHGKIQRREFAIEDDATGRELTRDIDWSLCFRPGQKVDMSITFPELDASTNHCPRCGTNSAASSEIRTQCTNPACNMWFQRVIQIEEPEVAFQVRLAKPGLDRAEHLNAQVPRGSKGPVLSPGDFHRVRLMRKRPILNIISQGDESASTLRESNMAQEQEVPSQVSTGVLRKPEPGQILVVKHAFCARASDELSLTKGDQIELIEDDEDFGDEWYLGRHCITGDSGLFPAVYATPYVARSRRFE